MISTCWKRRPREQRQWLTLWWNTETGLSCSCLFLWLFVFSDILPRQRWFVYGLERHTGHITSLASLYCWLSFQSISLSLCVRANISDPGAPGPLIYLVQMLSSPGLVFLHPPHAAPSPRLIDLQSFCDEYSTILSALLAATQLIHLHKYVEDAVNNENGKSHHCKSNGKTCQRGKIYQLSYQQTQELPRHLSKEPKTPPSPSQRLAETFHPRPPRCLTAMTNTLPSCFANNRLHFV